MRRWGSIALIALAGLGSSAAIAQTPTPAPESVVDVRLEVPPKKRTVKQKFRPWADLPAPTDRSAASIAKRRSLVALILREEREQHGGPDLMGRISCETGGTYLDNIANGSSGAGGLTQWLASSWAAFAPDPRRVVWDEVKKRKRPVVRVTTYADGTTKRETIRKRIQSVKVVRVGMLPRNPSRFHAWANVRRGLLHWNDTSWDCGV